MSYYEVPKDCQIPNLSEIYEMYLGHKEYGIFIEIGANDGEYVSNTCFLADTGWKGYYIEPLPDIAQKCRDRHKNNNVKVVELAICDYDGTANIYRSPDDEASGSVVLTDEQAEKYANEFTGHIEVPCMSIGSFMASEYIKPGIDLLVIDTEGTEYEILYNYNFDYYRPKMVIVETHANPTKINMLKELMQSYTVVYGDEINTVFVNNDIFFGIYKDNMKRDIKGVMSLPRLMMSDESRCIASLMVNIGIEVTQGGGAFWDQTMTNAMKKSMGSKYILAIDSDTLFEPVDVIRLYDILEKRDDIDCIAAMQTMRVTDKLLLNFKDEDIEEGIIPAWLMFCDTFEVTTAHFGLTLMRTEKLKHIEKPWFSGYAGDDGEWGNDRVDADIHFWNQWRAAGNNIHIANNVVVGHMELMACYPDKMLNKFYVHPIDVFNNGKPEKAWPIKAGQRLIE